MEVLSVLDRNIRVVVSSGSRNLVCRRLTKKHEIYFPFETRNKAVTYDYHAMRITEPE